MVKSMIQLTPLEGGEPIDIPCDPIVVGRGPLLKITDKRVSRNHANLEVNENKLVITPIHTNPCFVKKKGEPERITLLRDQPFILGDGDILGLLPDSLYFKVVYKHQVKADTNNSPSSVNSSDPIENNDQDDEDEDDENNSNKSESVSPKPQIGKDRVLPKWMIGSAKRMPNEVTKAPIPPRSTSPAKKTPKKDQPREVKVDADEEEISPPSKPGRGRNSAITSNNRKKRIVESESDQVSNKSDDGSSSEQDDLLIKKREPRMTAQKLLTYEDEFDMAEAGFSSSGSEVGGQFGARKESDSDFVLEQDVESASDWEVTKSHSPRSSKKGGRAKSRRAATGSRRSARTSSSQKTYYSDSEFDFSDEDEAYNPRPSRRRSITETKKKSPQKNRRRRKVESPSETSEDLEEESEEVAPRNKQVKRKKNGSSDEEEASSSSTGKRSPNKKTVTKNGNKKKKIKDLDSEDDEENGQEKRELCVYGKKCYRKNPKHFEEFCHPGDSSYSENEPEPEPKTVQKKTARVKGKKGTSDDEDDVISEEEPKQKTKEVRKRPAREKDKKSVLAGASDDDGEANTYDYDDSFMAKDESMAVSESSSSENNTGAKSESDWDPEDEDNVKSLVKEAKGFLRNKKMVKPSRNK